MGGDVAWDHSSASSHLPASFLPVVTRAALSLLRCARARAALKGRHYVTHEDVQKVAFGVLGHRLIMRPESAIEGREVSDVVKDVLKQVKVLETG